MSSEKAPAQGGLTQSVFSFDSTGVVRFLLSEVPLVPVATGDDASAFNSVNVELGANINMLADGRAEFRLKMRVTPDPRKRPYLIELELAGAFSATGASSEMLLKFCQAGAPAIVFPYARQIINEVTSNGRFGPIRLPLMNLNGMLATGVWEQTIPDSDTPSPLAPTAQGRRKKKAKAVSSEH
jgi:preprotein translocase subunit SecB